MAEDFFPLATLGVALAACFTDLRSRRIPNVLTFGAAAAALVLHTVLGGWQGAGTASTGYLVGLALFIPFFLLGGMGAGDVKLVAAIGAWLGPMQAVWVVLFASIAGGILAVGVALAHGYLGTAFANLRNLLWQWALVGPRPVAGLDLETSPGPRLAYAVPIFIGTAAAIWRHTLV